MCGAGCGGRWMERFRFHHQQSAYRCTSFVCATRVLPAPRLFWLAPSGLHGSSKQDPFFVFVIFRVGVIYSEGRA